MKYEQIDNNKYIVEFNNDQEKNEFLKFYNDTTTISSHEVEALGISRQLLRYYVNNGYVRTVPHGKQKRYLLEDIKKFIIK